MKEMKKAGENSLVIYISRIFDLFVGLVTMSLIARYLSLEYFGNYMIVMTSGWILATIVNMGIEQIMVREVARDKGNLSDYYVNGTVSNLLLFAFCMVLFTLFVPLLNFEKFIIAAMYINFAAEGMKVLMRVVVSLFIAFEEMIYDSLITIVSRSVVLLGTFFVVFYELDFIYLFIVCLFSSGTGLAIGLILLQRKKILKEIKVDFKKARYLVSESFPVGFNIVSQQIYFYIGVYVLSIMKDESAIALFQGPNKLVTIFQIIPVAILTALQPMMARLAIKASDKKLEFIYQKAFKFLFMISFPISVLGMALADKIILLIFGSGFLGSVITFRILIWCVNFIFLDVLLTSILTSMNRQKLLIIGNTMCIASNLMLGIILSGKYSYNGTASAALVSYFVLFSIDFYFVTSTLKCFPIRQGMLKIVLSSFISGIIIFKILNINIIISAVCGVLIYCGLILIFKTFTIEEKQLLKSSFG